MIMALLFYLTLAVLKKSCGDRFLPAVCPFVCLFTLHKDNFCKATKGFGPNLVEKLL